MERTQSTLLLFMTVLMILSGSGELLLWIPALYYGFESAIGSEVRAWWKGVKFRARVNKTYKDRSKRYEAMIKKEDEWQH